MAARQTTTIRLTPAAKRRITAAARRAGVSPAKVEPKASNFAICRPLYRRAEFKV